MEDPEEMRRNVPQLLFKMSRDLFKMGYTARLDISSPHLVQLRGTWLGSAAPFQSSSPRPASRDSARLIYRIRPMCQNARKWSIGS